MTDTTEAPSTDDLHIMFDLEALQGFNDDPRVIADGAITAIGAVAFTLGPERFDVLDEYYCRRVRLDSYPPQGTIDGDTLAWWLKQPAEAQVFAFPKHDDGCPYTVGTHYQAISGLYLWASALSRRIANGKFYMWSHYYDRLMLQGAASRHALNFDGFHRFRDYGTIEKATEMVNFRGATNHNEHNPVDDARTQAVNVVRFFKRHVK